MVVNLIKSKQMFSLTLPVKVNGQYWLTDLDEKQHVRQLVSIEAIDGAWFVKGNKKVRIKELEKEDTELLQLTDATYLNLDIEGTDERVILFTEPVDQTRQILTKIAVSEGAVFTVGRADDNNFIYNDRFVSSHHARLSYDGEDWSISDTDSLNGTYVNGFRIRSQKLEPGDLVYIMGLKIVIGSNFLAINNPNKRLKIRSDSLRVYAGQTKLGTNEKKEPPEKQFFLRSPRFHKEIVKEEIRIDPPPPRQKLDTVPMALMLGPSITMGLTSVSTGILAVANTISNGGDISQSIPTLVMSVSMLLGTVLWPILTKKHEKKEKIRMEKLRQEKYLSYLNEIDDLVRKKEKEQAEILCENISDQTECAERIVRKKSSLWERVIGQSDFLRLRFGIGSLPFAGEIGYQEKKFTMEDDSLQNAMLSLAEEPKVLSNVPISISLVDNIVLGLYGTKDATDNMLKSLILQMIALHSYDELKIMLIADESEAQSWSFVRYVPHFWDNERSIRFLATSPDEVKELSAYIERNILIREEKNRAPYSEHSPYYVIISTSSKLNKKCEALRGLLSYKSNVGFSLIISDDRFDAFPKETKTIVHVAGERSEIFDRDDTTGQTIGFSAERANEAMLDHISSKIANIELDLNCQKYSLPTMISFLEMFDVGKVEHLNSLKRWKENNPTNTLQTPVGVDVDGDIFHLDLHEKFHGPHGLIAGMTGSGKSEFIITYILSMAVNYHPDEVSFILIDYKGGGLAGAFEDRERCIKLPHLAGTITNLDGSAIKRSLTSIQSELRRRQALFNDARKVSNEGTMDIYKYQQLYRDKVVSAPLPHLFIISDEFAELKMQQPEFMDQLISTARIGRSLGVHLILATQKPGGVVDNQIWSNSKFRVCLKVQDKSDSQDMIKCPDAAELSQTGRFYLQVGFNEFFALGQSAWCGAEYVPADVVEKARDTSIQVIDDLGRVVMNVKPQTAQVTKEKRVKQVVSVVKYLSDLAEEEGVSVRPLWLEPIPAVIYVDDIERKYGYTEKEFVLEPAVGEYDDPFNQRQMILTVPISAEGNCLVYGATGSGKTTFLTTLCYSLLRHHDARELNLYLLDFGSETLKVFGAAPQVGGVILSSDEEKTVNLFKMLRQEMEARKTAFARFGGDYAGYCRSAASPVPNIVVVINNFSGFSEQYEELLEELTVLSRDGVKYGIFFIMTASSTNAVRYKIQQNFKTMLTMQLNDATDYPLIVGKTEGLIPEKHKGRGLAALDKPYEFQTAYALRSDDQGDAIRNWCGAMARQSETFAKEIPVLPKRVDLGFVEKHLSTLRAIPVGVSKNTLELVTVNLSNRVAFPVAALDADECGAFVSELPKVLARLADTRVIDAEAMAGSAEYDPEAAVLELFAEMVKRNNTYKDANLDESVLKPFAEQVYVIVGFKKFIQQLSPDGRDKMKTLLEKAEAIYKIHFVLCDSLTNLNSFSYDEWFKRHLANADGIWIGDGVADQYLLKVSKITSDLYNEIEADYGYTVIKGRPSLTKLLSESREDR